MERIESLITRYWPKLLEVYISPLSQPNQIAAWQVELKFSPNHFLPIGHAGDEKSFQAPTVDDALRQAEEFMDP